MARHRHLLPLSAIECDRIPFRRVLDLCMHIARGGVVPPIHVQHPARRRDTAGRGTGRFSARAKPGADRSNSKRYLLLDGRHRWMAYKLLGKTHIEVTYGS